MAKCCDIVYWKHDDGWDAYQRSECELFNGKWIPKWFDDFVIEDAPTKADAVRQIKEMHILGVCLVKG